MVTSSFLLPRFPLTGEEIQRLARALLVPGRKSPQIAAQTGEEGNFTTFANRATTTYSPFSSGFRLNIRATTPATCGVAVEVPEKSPQPDISGQVVAVRV